MTNTETENSYYDNTYNSPYPLRRWAQRARVKKSLDAVSRHTGQKLLDYGCGDALFISQLASPEWSETNIFGFEPFLEILPGCKSKVFKTWEETQSALSGPHQVDVVTCFEVLEHLDETKQEEALNNMRSILAPNGTIVISVPIECGFPAIPKNVLRRRAWGWSASSPDGEWSNVCTISNILKSVAHIPVPEHRQGKDYLSHMGFYFTDLEKVFSKCSLSIADKAFSPIALPIHHINSQVFYKLQKS